MSPKIERLTLKMLRTDKLALRRLAAIEGEPMSVVVRRILRTELESRGLLPLTGGNQQEVGK
jgi:hypothetical protein